jgi:hypothetical protein
LVEKKQHVVEEKTENDSWKQLHEAVCTIDNMENRTLSR